METNNIDNEMELKDKSELSLNNLRKWDLIRYIKKLEQMIHKYDEKLMHEYEIKKECISYIESHTYCESKKKYLYDLTNRETKELLKKLKEEPNEITIEE